MKRLSILLPLLALLLCSCKGRISSGQAPEEPELPDTLRLEISADEVLTGEDMQRSDIGFADFFYFFAASEQVQRKHVRFPLPVSKDGVETLMEKNEWEQDSLMMAMDYYTLLFDSEDEMARESETERDSVRMEWFDLDDMSVRTFLFNAGETGWMLERITFRQVAHDGNDNFVDFYRQFARDSVFQVNHLSRRLKYVTLDPDDEFSILETRIGASEWNTFKPELPARIITNIDYGQRNEDLSSEKIVKINGSSNGFENILFFRRRGGVWELYRFEDTSI